VRQTTKKQGQQTDMTVQRLRDVRVWQRAPRVQKVLYSQTKRDCWSFNFQHTR